MWLIKFWANPRAVVFVALTIALAVVGLLLSSFSDKTSAQQVPQVVISGTVVDNGGRGLIDVIISVDGTRRAVVVTGPGGVYSVSVPQGGSYILTPSQQATLFNPPSLRLDAVNSNQTNINFVGTRTRTYKVSGKVSDVTGRPLGDVVIRVSDSPQILTITGPTGDFNFDFLVAGTSYSMVPAKSGFTFDPPAIAISNLNGNLSGLQFVAVPSEKVRLSGIVTDSLGQPLTDVIVGLAGGESALSTTGTTGAFTFAVSSGRNYIVAPAREGYTFTPSSLSFTNLTQNQSSLSFVGAPAPTVTISGSVMDSNFTPLVDVPVVLTGSASITAPTNPVGIYGFKVLSTGTYTVTPVVPGLIFTPPSRTFASLTSDQINVNFVANPGGLNATDAQGRPLLNLGDASPTPTPDASPSPSPYASPTPFATPRANASPSPSPGSKQATKKEEKPSTPTPGAKPAEEKVAAVPANARGRRRRTRRRVVRSRVRSKRTRSTARKPRVSKAKPKPKPKRR